MCVRLTDRALCLTEFASGETICLKQRAPETALYCASGRSSLQFATANWRWGTFGDDRPLTLGIMGGQFAGLVAILPAIAASQANLAALAA